MARKRKARSALLICGMHRSGTSLVAGALSIVGGSLAKNQVAAAPDNVKGFFEPADLVQIDEEIFRSTVGGADDWRPFPRAWFKSAECEKYKARLIKAIEDNYDGNELLIIKDPRLCRLLPLYIDALASLGIEPKAIIPFRDPVEVAGSLETRDGIIPAASLLLWARYIIESEFGSRDLKRVFVAFEKFLDDPVKCIGKIEKALGVKFPEKSRRAFGELAKFVEPELRHHAARKMKTVWRGEPALWMTKLYSAYNKFQSNPHSAAACAAMDTIAKDLDASSGLFSKIISDIRMRQGAIAAKLDESNAGRERLKAELHSKSEQSVQLQNTIELRATEIESLRVELQKKAEDGARLSSDLQSQIGECGRLRNDLQASISESERLKLELQARSLEISRLDGELRVHSEQMLQVQNESHSALEERNRLIAELKVRTQDHEKLKKDLKFYAEEHGRLEKQLSNNVEVCNQLQNELKSRDEIYGQLQKDLQSLVKERDQLHKELAARGEEFTRIQSHLRSGVEERDQLRKELKARGEDYLRLQRSIEERDRLQEELTARAEECTRLQSDLQGGVEERARLQEELTARVEEGARLQSDLQSGIEERDRLQKELTVRVEEYARLWDHLQTGIEERNRLQEELAIYEEDYSRLQSHIEERVRLQNEVHQSKSENDRLIAEVQDKSSKLDKLRSELRAVIDKNENLQKELRTREESSNRLQAELQKQLILGKAKADEFAGLKASLSWRLTGPLRLFEGAGAGEHVGPAKQPRAHPRRLARNYQADKVAIIAASKLFDADWYLAQNPDVAAAGVDPIVHYLASGAAEGRDPHPLFDNDWYLSQNNDVAVAGINPLLHYIDKGASEGRDPNPFFDTGWYVSRSKNFPSDFNPLEHYMSRGAAEHQNPSPLFDGKWYQEQNPDVRSSGQNPLTHYLTVGQRENRDPHPLFDADWYLARNPGVAGAGINPVTHYLQTGAREGRDPHPLFDSDWYLAQNPDVAEQGMNPLLHYIISGAAERRNPHPLFQTDWYVSRNPDVLGSGLNPLVHFIYRGGFEGRNPNPQFDCEWYLTEYPDARASGMNPLIHYVEIGLQEGRKTHPGAKAKVTPAPGRAVAAPVTQKPVARRQPATSVAVPADTNPVPISVVIPTYNRAETLRATLRDCFANSGGIDLEFVVIDDGSKDETPKVLAELESEIPNLVWKSIPNGGAGQARNIGVSLAKHNVVLFLGDDIQPLNDDFFRTHSLLHSADPSDRFAVLGKVTWPTDAEAPVNFVMAHIQGHGGEQFGYADLSPHTFIDWRFFYTCNISVKKTVIDDWVKNGFRAEFKGAGFEDIELAYRLFKEAGSFSIYYDPTSIAHHIHHYDVGDFINRQTSVGLFAQVFIDLHPEMVDRLGLRDLVKALHKPMGSERDRLTSDYLSVIEGIKSWARIIQARNIMGREAWHDDLLFCVFELSFLHGFCVAQQEADLNFEEGYAYILDRCLKRLRRTIHHELASHEFIQNRVLGIAAE